MGANHNASSGGRTFRALRISVIRIRCNGIAFGEIGLGLPVAYESANNLHPNRRELKGGEKAGDRRARLLDLPQNRIQKDS